MDHPSRRIWARRQLEAMKQAGLSRDDIMALLEEEPGKEDETQHINADASTFQNLSYHDLNASFKPPPPFRSSMLTVSSSSSRDSCFSATSTRSSASSSLNLAGEAKFWCTSCNKTFKRKFDWKRHEEEFHDRSRKYPCDSCNQSFWGPNTFNQHHKSAHGCRSCPHAEMVMRPMKKRRAYGCGFCAALHGQFERHIDHVATHFETGMTKRDWSHSNVIYGLLHQHGIIESWKSLVATKHNQFHDRQPMFGWSPESTGRAHGFVENENPGQLQDLLEFFDGSKESAKRIIQLAETCVHVVLRTKSPPSSPASSTAMLSLAGQSMKSPRVSRSSVREPRRSTSMSAMLSAAKADRRTVSSSNVSFETPPPMPGIPSMTLPSSSSQQISQATTTTTTTSNNAVYQNYIPNNTTTGHAHALTPIQTHANTYEDKALPPPPLDPNSPMAVDYPSFPEHHPHPHHSHHQHQHIPPAPSQPQSFLPEVVDFMSDWQSFTSTLVGDEQQQQQQHQQQQHQQQQQAMSTFGFPMSWDDLGHFSRTPGP